MHSWADRGFGAFINFLAGLTLASAASGKLFSIGTSGGSLVVYPVQVLGPILLAFLLISLATRSSANPLPGAWSRIGLAFGLIAIGLIPLAVSANTGPALAAYFNFCTGISAGFAVGVAWSRTAVNKFTAMDLGLAVFIFASAAQVLIAIYGGDLTYVHENANTAWGGSNYVAGVLTVALLIAAQRAILVDRGKILLAAAAVVGGIGCLATLSRGGAIALAAGLAVMLWGRGRVQFTRVLTRIIALAVPIVGFVLVQAITDSRLQINQQAAMNLQLRGALYEVAFNEFLRSPFVGTGWAGLELAAYPVLGSRTTYAHNVLLSFLQIGGLTVGLTLLLAITWGLVRGLRAGPIYAAPLVAAVFISLSDPFLEGTVGAAFFWVAVMLVDQHRRSPHRAGGRAPKNSAAPRVRRHLVSRGSS